MKLYGGKISEEVCKIFYVNCFLILICVVLLYNKANNPIIVDFELSQNTIILERFLSDEQIGPIDSVEAAIENVRELFVKMYGSEHMRRCKFTLIGYDSDTDTWKVSFSLLSPMQLRIGNMVAQSPCAIVQSDGKVLTIYA